MLKWCDHAYGIKHVILRYFNASGAARFTDQADFNYEPSEQGNESDISDAVHSDLNQSLLSVTDQSQSAVKRVTLCGEHHEDETVSM